MNSEQDMVAVFYREKAGTPWQFVCYCLTRDVGHQFAAALQQEERFVHFNKKAEAIVVWREKADAGKIKPLKPPKGWSPDLAPDKEVLEYAKKIEAEKKAEEARKARLEEERKAAEKEARRRAREAKKKEKTGA